MSRSNERYPLVNLDLANGLQMAWEKGWLNDFSDDHFLIKAIEKRLDQFPPQFKGSLLMNNNQITCENFQINFCINFSSKIKRLILLFGEDSIKRFFTDQLSAGKNNYDEEQFFRALSEVSILSFLGMNAHSGEYEPRTNGKKNPEARFHCNNGVTVDVEVKTPGFKDFKGIKDIVIPTVLLDEAGRTEFLDYCNIHGLNGAMPRALKLKDFLNSAAVKFENVDHFHHMNLLYLNWTSSEFMDSGYQEALSLLVNPVNGILIHKDIGLKLGVCEDVYEKITAVIVYTELLQGLMFGDFRWVWNRGLDGQPFFGIVGLHNHEGLFDITGMNPKGRQITPIVTGIFSDTKYVNDLMPLIEKHMLKSEQTEVGKE